MRRFSKIILLLAVISTGIAGFAFTKYDDVYFTIKKNFTIFSEVYREVSLRYVDKVDPEKLMRKGLNAMLDALDPYTILIDESESQQFDIITTGTYGGVGIEVGYKRGQMVVITPIEGYSAYRKGIKAGDIILSVDGLSLDELTAGEVQNIMYGEPGTTVTLKIKRYGFDQPLTFELERERIEVKNVDYAGLIGPDAATGYIILTRFSQNTAEEIRNAITKFKKNEQLKGVILDLRNNPGGLLEEAVRTVDKFIKPGIEVVRTKGRIAEHNSVFKSSEPALLDEDIPLVVLQNGGSASASEVVTGALQDLDRAVIIGEQSFGKGLVQIIRPLSYNTALKITTSKYYTPSGRSIQYRTYTHDDYNSVLIKEDSVKKAFKTRNGRTVYGGEGIMPDVVVEEPDQSLLQIELMRNSHYFFFANQYTSGIDSLVIPGKEELLDEFLNYLEAENFEYQTQTESMFESVKNQLASHSLLSQKISSIREVEELIATEKKQQFEAEKNTIYDNIYTELAKRISDQERQIEASIQTDQYLQRALSIIQNRQKYNSLLMPSR